MGIPSSEKLGEVFRRTFGSTRSSLPGGFTCYVLSNDSPIATELEQAVAMSCSALRIPNRL